MRLIDADALLKEYEGAFAYKLLKEVVGNMPTVEVTIKINKLKNQIENAKETCGYAMYESAYNDVLDKMSELGL